MPLTSHSTIHTIRIILIINKIKKTMQAQPPLEPSPIPQQAGAIARIDSQLLLCGQRIIEIDHCGQRYTLRVTRENKLILTK